jgi:hypothetical protein
MAPHRALSAPRTGRSIRMGLLTQVGCLRSIGSRRVLGPPQLPSPPHSARCSAALGHAQASRCGISGRYARRLVWPPWPRITCGRFALDPSPRIAIARTGTPPDRRHPPARPLSGALGGQVCSLPPKARSPITGSKHVHARHDRLCCGSRLFAGAARPVRQAIGIASMVRLARRKRPPLTRVGGGGRSAGTRHRFFHADAV